MDLKCPVQKRDCHTAPDAGTRGRHSTHGLVWDWGQAGLYCFGAILNKYKVHFHTFFLCISLLTVVHVHVFNIIHVNSFFLNLLCEIIHLCSTFLRDQKFKKFYKFKNMKKKLYVLKISTGTNTFICAQFEKSQWMSGQDHFCRTYIDSSLRLHSGKCCLCGNRTAASWTQQCWGPTTDCQQPPSPWEQCRLHPH